jgi:UDP-glucose:(heptosyl)LPS alpha-1,3-glucosyltransferase
MSSDGQSERGAGTAPPLPEITIVAHDIGPVGGMERQLVDLILGLRRLGHDVSVIGRTLELPAGTSVRFHRVRTPGRPFSIAYPAFMLAGTLAVRRHRRGVVQATGAIVLNRVDAVAVHYSHQVGPVNPSRTTMAFRLNAAVASLLKRLGERLSFRANRPAAFVCVSDGVAEEMRRAFPALAPRVTTIHNGIDTDAFAPGRRAADGRALRARLGLTADQLVAAFVGSEWERKGLEPALRALAAAPGWTLLVAGAGDRARYESLAGELGVAERVRFLGVSSDVAVVYAAADAFLLPSRYETFSLVTFEAAASGLAVLAAPVSGVRELIEDGRNGLIIGRDPEQIAARLRELASDPGLRERLGQAARASALAFSTERMVQAHHDLYARLAAEQTRT